MEIKALVESDIGFVSNCVQLFLTYRRQIYIFGQVLADQAINIFVITALPRAARTAEVIVTSVR